MARRTQVYQQIPWAGGLNTSVESGILPDGELTICDNVVMLTTGVKQKRDGFSYWDSTSDVPTVATRSSSGTTRTVVFASTLTPASIEKLVVGESITISGTYTNSASYNGTYNIATVSGTTITYTAAGSLTEGSTASTEMTVVRTYPHVKITDFWYNSSGAQAQQRVAVSGQGKVFKYDDSGRRTECTGSITARAAVTPRANTATLNETLLIFQDGTGNVPLKWTGSALSDLAATAPDASIGEVWLDRVWTNDKTDLHRLHYSATGSLSDWQGVSDSGAIDIRPGDGDALGITSIFVFKGVLFIGKGSRLYRVDGNSPENFLVSEISTGIGVAAQGTVCAVDQQDVFYWSNKGIHNVTTTSSYGDFLGSFISRDIQPSFNDWEATRTKHSQVVYLPTLNSLVMTVAESTTTAQDSLWLFNVLLKKWYRWPDVAGQSVAIVQDSSAPRLYVGIAGGKILRYSTGDFIDYGTTAVRYRVKTGTIYPDQSPMTIKAFKRLTLFFRPKTSYSFDVKVKIEGAAEQSLNFNGQTSGDLLGTTFVLGESNIGSDLPFAPRSLPIDGYGYGVTIDVLQTGTGEKVDIYGFAIEYEPADVSQEGASALGGNA